MDNNPKVSIIMGTYNCSKYLDDCMDSILNQSCRDFEFIICDDGSTDDTYEILEKYKKKDKRIVLLKNDSNLGLNKTLNRCIKIARGEYIARQDADDISVNNRLEKEVAFLDREVQYSIVSCNMDFFDEKSVWGKTNFNGEVSKNDFITGSPFVHAAALMRAEHLRSVGGYSEDKKLLRVEDYHLWCKFYTSGYKGYNLPDILYRCRDDREAIGRKTIKNRWNLFILTLWIYRQLNIPLRYIYIPFKQIVLIVLPKNIYKKLHMMKWRNNEL